MFFLCTFFFMTCELRVSFVMIEKLFPSFLHVFAFSFEGITDVVCAFIKLQIKR
jgi:hypothetical protein